MTASAQQILIVGPSWVGDMVMSQSLYRVLQDTRPGCAIDVLAPAWSEAILARMPEVRASLTLPLAHGELGLGKRWHLGRQLAGRHYDQAILLPNSLKSALLPMFAGIPLRTGWRGEMRFGLLNDIRLLKERELPLMVQRFVALGLDEGSALPADIPPPALVANAEGAAAAAARFGLDTGRPILALCPGAEFGSAKRWPEAHYGELARRYLERGWQVCLYGSGNDRPVTAAIRSAAGASADCFDLAGQTSLGEAVDLLSLSTAVVSNDSGLMHIAAALNRPTLAIYGATSPGFTPPLSSRSATVVSDIACAPCFQRECPLGHHRCMRDQLPHTVGARLDSLLESPACAS
ncbi:lipopolysaccharide heptosyltransferase II [Parahaliea aestuarii]|uniref:lipopolysaccharide heptosyltransferase II n=1 Tax=Parahaliea aestuarii TaxID=1852021 RepID=A0A5C8ZUT3_9GAMM|nr:lipopolysaccharide heptosyltransferase II [Parahaliea aestuarii]TXS92273.1 lipopolysaccharide heptosyltransferase II [Parahaliea aestuarii]